MEENDQPPPSLDNVVSKDHEEKEKEEEEVHHSLPSPETLKTGEKEGGIMQTIAGVAGNILEWYDFALFGYFSDIIGSVFFPKQDGNAAIVESFMIFGSAFLFRPVGGILMGYIGDKFGRKKALELSIFLMAFPTFLMGCLPSYEKIGGLAPVLLTLIRILQGFSVGGQLMSSLVYTVESHPKTKWGLYGSFVMAAASFGTLLGSVVAFAFRAILTEEQLYSWGWRIPFLCGILVGFSALYLKYHCHEDHSGATISEHGEVNPITEAFSPSNRRALLSSCLVPILWSSGFYISFVWMAIYMKDLILSPVPRAFLVNSLSLLLTCVLMFPLSGHLSDVYGRTRVMSIGGCGLALLGPPMVYLIGIGNPVLAFFSQVFIGILLSLWGSPMCAWLAESFPPEIRLTAVAIGYNMAHAIFGGFSPAIATVMVSSVGPNSPGFLYTIAAVLALIGLFVAPVHKAIESETTEVENAPESENLKLNDRKVTAPLSDDEKDEKVGENSDDEIV